MGMVSSPLLDEVWLVSLNPTVGSEIQKTRPCVVVSPEEANQMLRTVIVAPMTRSQRKYPTRVPVVFQKQSGEIALDQLRSVDRSRFVRRLGSISRQTAQAVSDTLVE